MRAYLVAVAIIGLTGASHAGCTLATATSGYEAREPLVLCGSDGAIRDLVVDLTGFSAHLQHTLRGDVVRVVPATMTTPRMRLLIGRFVLDPGGRPDPLIIMPCLLDAGNQYQVDVSVDVPDTMGVVNGELDCPPLMGAPPECHDHQWELEVQGDGHLDYVHDLLFEDVSVDPATPAATNRPVRVTLAGADDFVGSPLEVHVRRIDATAGEPVRRTVYLHRLGEIPPGGSVTVPRAGTFVEDTLLAEDGEDYEIAFWVDSNEDGLYQPPSFNGVGTNRDVSWLTTLRTDTGGLLPVFNATTPMPMRVDIRVPDAI